MAFQPGGVVVRKGMLENGGSGLNTGYWVGTYKLTFFSNSVEKYSLIVKKFLNVAKIAWNVYEAENCSDDHPKCCLPVHEPFIN